MSVKRILTLLLLCCLFLAACGESEEQAALVPEENKTRAIPDIKLPKASKETKTEQVMLYYDGLLFDRACVRDDTVYISPDSISDYYALEISCSVSQTDFEVQGKELYMYGRIADEYMQANYRYLYTPERYIVENDRVYLSKDVIEKVFGVKVTVFGEPKQVEISTDGVSIMPGGANFYQLNFSSEDLFWLPRIIYAETRDQPLEGLIGVGNVIYNRVEHELFPDTVFEVIFDNKHAVQFTPAATGSVLGDPDERSVVAAYLCLEGYNTAGESLYFVNPKKANSSWFEEKLQFVCSMGDHDFYC